MFRTGLVLLALLGLARSECPNACSGHGDCGAYDKCQCYRNWQAADCSERTCPFGLAHVDIPKGDLDGSSGDLTGKSSDSWATVSVVDIDPINGMQELYPKMADTSGNVKSDTAHGYSECSSKGLCDRATGLCKCITGYEGHACQRASCPNSCSGHGTCETIEDLARWDNNNVYKLWDRKMTMGCKCDPGYQGPDCSLRVCKVGIDPWYTNLVTTANVPSWQVSISGTTGVSGTYAIKFYDSFGEDYVTAPITHSSSDYCTSIKSALMSLPNSVVPDVTCTTTGTPSATSYVYELTFTKNPGDLKQIEINSYLDGARPTLYSTAAGTSGTVTAATVSVTTAGSNGESSDYFTNYCEGVVVTVSNANNPWWGAATLTTASSAQDRLLKQCLGDSDGNPSNNRDYENWDYGSWSVHGKEHIVGQFPHAIKLVPVNRASSIDPGHTNLLWYSNHTGSFKLLSKRPTADAASTQYYVFTSDAVAEQIVYDQEAPSGGHYNTKKDAPLTGWWAQYTNTIYTSKDASCESGNDVSTRLSNCLKKGDKIFLPAAGYGYLQSTSANVSDGTQGLDLQGFVGDYPSKSGKGVVNTTYASPSTLPYTGQLYTITKIWKMPPTQTSMTKEDRFRITVDKNINWDASDIGKPYGNYGKNNVGVQYIFKFTPNTTYTYVSECSNRGSCDRSSGLCQCFKGYTNDACDVQSALAV